MMFFAIWFAALLVEVFATIGNGQVTLFPPSNLGRFMYWRRFELVCKHLTLGDNGQPDDKLSIGMIGSLPRAHAFSKL